MTQTVLPKRRLGRTGFRVTPIGLGAAHLGSTAEGASDQAAMATVHCALGLGVNLIDTAPLYGESQRRIGMALAEWYRAGGRRQDLVICTKTGRSADGAEDFSADGTRRSVEESLRLLRTDYLDILLMHEPKDLVAVLGPGGALQALQELKEDGVIRAIGLGARSHESHRRCIATGELDVSLTYRDYNLISQSAAQGVLEAADAHDVGVLNGAAVMLGLLSGTDPRKTTLQGRNQQKQRAYELWEWAQARGVNLLALNLQFCMREQRIASTLVGAANPAEIGADVAALSEALPDDVWQELHERFGVSG